MRILIGLFAILTASMCFAMFSPAGATPAEAAGGPVTVKCPDYVDTGIVNPPQGWAPFTQPGGSRINFQSIVAAKEYGTPKVMCAYGRKGEVFAIFFLSRAFPTNYVCSVDKAGTGIASQSATCAPRTRINRD